MESKSKKRFLFLIGHYYPVIYGAELFAKKVAEFLVEKGHVVDVITGRWSNDWSDFEVVKGVNIHRFSTLKTRYIQTIYSMLPMYMKFNQLLNLNNYDYIHAHIFPALLVGSVNNRKTKSIVTIQGGDLEDYPEIYGPFAYAIKPMIANSLKNYTKIHTVSSDLNFQVKTLTNKSSITIPNGVDIPIYKNFDKKLIGNKYNLPPDCILGFSSSRLTDKNNLIETVLAIHHLNNPKIHLAIAGTGHLESKLINLIKDHKLEKNIHLLGGLIHKDSLELLKASDFFIRVSTKEGFGIAALEALALKIPVISSQAGGLKDFVKKENAWIPDSNDFNSISKTINNFLTESIQTVKDKINKGYSLVEKEYLWSKILDQVYHDLYEL